VALARGDGRSMGVTRKSLNKVWQTGAATAHFGGKSSQSGDSGWIPGAARLQISSGRLMSLLKCTKHCAFSDKDVEKREELVFTQDQDLDW